MIDTNMPVRRRSRLARVPQAFAAQRRTEFADTTADAAEVDQAFAAVAATLEEG